MSKRKKSKPFDPEKLDRFVSSSPNRLSDTAKQRRILQGTHKQSRQWLAEHLVDQKNCCAYCRRPIKKGQATLDHIVPLARNGLHDKLNTCAACKPCNTLKADMLVEEFLPILEAQRQKKKAELEHYHRNKSANQREET